MKFSMYVDKCNGQDNYNIKGRKGKEPIWCKGFDIPPEMAK